MTRCEADYVILEAARRMADRIRAPEDWTLGEAVTLGLGLRDPVARVLETANFKLDDDGDRPDVDRATLAEACKIADELAEATKAIDKLVDDRNFEKFLTAVGDLSIWGVADALEDRAAALLASGEIDLPRRLKASADLLRQHEG